MLDSEVSAIRRIDLRRKIVQTLVGKGLFVFGHRDGSLEEARLQHPLGVTTCRENRIYVADTYNHSLRVIDFVEQKVSTLVSRSQMKTICNVDDP